MNPTLHILPNPYGITDLRYRMEPFNIAVHKFISSMQKRGWNTIHYGHESSTVDCENVVCTTLDDVTPKGDHELFSHDNMKKTDVNVSVIAGQRANLELQKRCRPKDIVLCFYGLGNKPAVTDLDNVFICEPSIGYGGASVFSPYRVFTSYAIMHYYYGLNSMMINPSWFDAVIPNAFTPSEFDFSVDKKDYLLIMGRIITNKGIDLAIQLAEKTGHRLVIAGPGNIQELGYKTLPKHVEVFGYANADQRRVLLRDAKALIAPTYYIEPFGNMVVEALFSGTPVISSDWGGFVDTNPHGITGYRCRDFYDFVQAVHDLPKIDNKNCREWAMLRYADDVVHDQFDTYLKKLYKMDFYGKNI